jgi:hypothetical protein
MVIKILKKNSRIGGVGQAVEWGPEFKPQYCKKKKNVQARNHIENSMYMFKSTSCTTDIFFLFLKAVF